MFRAIKSQCVPLLVDADIAKKVKLKIQFSKVILFSSE